MDYLRSLGFKVIPYTLCRDMDRAGALIEDLNETRYTLSYDIDGAVMKLNDLAARERMGSTAKFPRWAAAFKYPPEIKSTVLEDIVVQVGRTGVPDAARHRCAGASGRDDGHSRDAPQSGFHHGKGHPHR